MLEAILVSMFCVSAALIIYHHLGYPLLLKFASNKASKVVDTQSNRAYQANSDDKLRPSVTIVVPAYNEQNWIAQKIRNLACIDYPKNKFKVIIACDGCADDTAEIAEATIQEAICCETHFEIIKFNSNRGKVALINHIMTAVDSDITALSDVSALISIDALLLAEQRFSDPKVGVVNSHYHILNTNNQGERDYWRYQTMLQQGEANIGANIGAHGALYFFRTHLFKPLADNVINDDFVLPMQIIKRGHTAVYEPNVIALELESSNQRADFKRRIRISAGNMQQIVILAKLLMPRYRAIAFAFMSGKTLRLLTPYLMLICLFTSLALISNSIFQALAIGQIMFYAIALAGMIAPSTLNQRLVRVISYFVLGHFANLYGGLRYLFGLENGRWERV